MNIKAPLITVILSGMLLVGCGEKSKGMDLTVAEAQAMKVAQLKTQLNPDELYAVISVQNTTKDPELKNKKVSQVVDMFESQTGTKVVRGPITDFKDLKVRDLDINYAYELVNSQATKEQITQIRKYVQQGIAKNERDKLLDTTLGEILKN